MLTWDGDDLYVGDDHFRAVTWTTETSTTERLVVWKYRSMIEDLARLVSEIQPRRILDLGIAQGGSVGLLAALAPEAIVVAVDIAPPNDALAADIERRGLQERVRPHYGIDQGDPVALRSIIRAEFGDEPIDLVIDDASHELGRTRRAFDTILPFVAPGGRYIVEDWAWCHHDVSGLNIVGVLPDGPPLTPIVVDMLMIVGTDKGVLERVDVNPMWAQATRGPATLDPDRWTRPDSYYINEPILRPEVS